MEKKKILIVILAIIFLAAIVTLIIYLAKKAQKKTEESALKTVQTGGTNINTTQTGGTSVNTSGSDNMYVPVYETGWDAFKVGDKLENISGSSIAISALKKLYQVSSWTPIEKAFNKYATLQGFTMPKDYMAAVNIPLGEFGVITYIDSSKIQIWINPIATMTGSGSTIPTFWSMTRAEFNSNYAGKIAFKK